MKTYQEYKKIKNEQWNKLPVFYGYSMEQIKEQMKQRNIDSFDKITRIYAGTYCLKEDVDLIHNFLANDELDDLMKDFDFAKDAFYYEMGNHEYEINTYQGNYDVLSCFFDVEYEDDDYDYSLYFKQLNLNDSTKNAYRAARIEYLRNREWEI
ncbi:hypothetical protein KQI68_06465 [Peptoniphilus sp. MSJ-1]|uniref:Uncharacterized protein n=1 Tax=Peptoniphilus ovalis TaxID=2841503 RepID=A0ABS6FJU7_9FIRM|nr:hypothetical protein [Peptoniphilus ovalis]MBU5669480.1 hypothetical protein [Peptoniphilus ovalis]